MKCETKLKRRKFLCPFLNRWKRVKDGGVYLTLFPTAFPRITTQISELVSKLRPSWFPSFCLLWFRAHNTDLGSKKIQSKLIQAVDNDKNTKFK